MTKTMQEVILSRKSDRFFCWERPPIEAMEAVLDAAASAPSERNRQPWAFLLIDDREVIAEIAGVMKNSQFLARAPYLVAVYLSPERAYEHTHDLLAIGAAIENMLLSAAAMDIGTCWIGEAMAASGEILLDRYQVTGAPLALVAFGYTALPRARVPKLSREELMLA